MKKVLYILGTRPEAIKLAPLIIAMQNTPGFNAEICVTGQHKDMTDQMLDFFKIRSDYNLKVMSRNQSLSLVTSKILTALDAVLEKAGPDLVVVQGDTASAFVGALAAYYRRIPIAHVEAGLRSGDKFSPFPEEGYRIMISRLATYHFAPTQSALRNLKKEGIIDNVWITGNTVIDALLLTKKKIYDVKKHIHYKKKYKFSRSGNKIILVTGHRRESFGRPLEEVCRALIDISNKNKNTDIVYPVHPNPNVTSTVQKILGGRKRTHLIKPVDYPEFVWLMDRCHFIITDSGGVQEEASSLGKPVLITRKVTERTESVEAGGSVVVGTDRKKISKLSNELLRDPAHYKKMARARNLYGDGSASKKIINIIRRYAR
mgnify:CR=1 FL=1